MDLNIEFDNTLQDLTNGLSLEDLWGLWKQINPLYFVMKHFKLKYNENANIQLEILKETLNHNYVFDERYGRLINYWFYIFVPADRIIDDEIFNYCLVILGARSKKQALSILSTVNRLLK